MFAIGDKVVIKGTPYLADELSNGQTGVVMEVLECDNVSPSIMYSVSMDNGHASHAVRQPTITGGWWCFCEQELELVSV